MIEVTVNGDARAVEDGTTVEGVVAVLDRGPGGLAVAVNGDVVPRSRWATTPLSTHDRVEVLTAAQGG
jgi:sulfur carrier protein